MQLLVWSAFENPNALRIRDVSNVSMIVFLLPMIIKMPRRRGQKILGN